MAPYSKVTLVTSLASFISELQLSEERREPGKKKQAGILTILDFDKNIGFWCIGPGFDRDHPITSFLSTLV